MNALRPAETNATSLESTGWCLPSYTLTRRSCSAKPAIAPSVSTWRTPFSTAGMNWPGITPPTTSSTNSKPDAALERLDAQVHLAELTGAAGLFLVPAMTVGRTRDRLAVGHARRTGLDRDAIAFGDPLQHHAQVQVAEAVEHGLVLRGVMFDAHARVLGRQAMQAFGQLLFVAALLRADRQAQHRRRERDGLQVKVIFVVRVVQHGVEMDLVDLRHRADVARHRLRASRRGPCPAAGTGARP